jgi:hypothetical protein
MKNLSTKLKLAALFAVLAAVPFVAGMYSERASAHEAQHTEVAQAQVPQPALATEEAYSYTAQTDDSYTLMARKAIQTYGINANVNLSPAQIIYAETLLTQEASSPLLTVGQKVTIKTSTVKNWVDKAGALSAEAKTAWQAYANGVDFNTNHVGQAH